MGDILIVLMDLSIMRDSWRLRELAIRLLSLMIHK